MFGTKWVDGVAVTTAARTAFDLGRHTVSRLRAVQRLDALVNATDVKLVDIESVMAAHPDARGMSLQGSAAASPGE